jgi:hypothetical protein
LATRFYLPSSGTPAVSPAYSAEWNRTARAGRYPAVTTKTNTAAIETSLTSTATNPEFHLAGQFISAPVNAGTISGTVKGQIRARENNDLFGGTVAVRIKVVSNDGTTVRGVLLDNTAALPTARPPHVVNTATAVNRKFTASDNTTVLHTLTPVTALANDRIVIEVGGRDIDAGTSRSMYLTFQDDQLTDLGENNTDTAGNPWVEFSADVFSTPSATTYTLTGPSSGTVNIASPSFTVTPDGLATGIVITPHSTGAGTFSPTSVTLSGSSAATFTYTPTSTTGSPHTISTTNSGTLTNPASLSYVVNSASSSNPTRFYLPSTGAAPVGPAFSTQWNRIGTAVRRPALTAKSGSVAAEVAMTSTATSPEYHLAGQFVSVALPAGSISGTVKGQIRARENNGLFQGTVALRIKVVSNDGATLRGVLLEITAPDATSRPPHVTTSSTAQNRKFTASDNITFLHTLTPVTALANDRIVIEVGGHDADAATTHSMYITFEDGQANDLGENNTDTAGNPWVEFSQALFPAGGGGATSYALTGPSSGTVGITSSSFTVTPNGTATGVVITPHTTGSGTFSPTSVTLSGSGAAAFAYTPSSTAGSPHVISVTNSSTLTNPSSLNYTVNAAPTGGTFVCTTVAELNAAIAAATWGDTIKCSYTSIFESTFTLPYKAGRPNANSFITITTTAPASSLPVDGQRITPTFSGFLPKFRAVQTASNTNASAFVTGKDATTGAGAQGWILKCLEIQPSLYGNGVMVRLGSNDVTLQWLKIHQPKDCSVIQCFFNGHPIVGTKRGMEMHGINLTCRDSYFKNIGNPKGQGDSAVWWVFNGEGPYTTENNYAEGGTYGYFTGGDNSKIATTASATASTSTTITVDWSASSPIGDPPVAGDAIAAIVNGGLLRAHGVCDSYVSTGPTSGVITLTAPLKHGTTDTTNWTADIPGQVMWGVVPGDSTIRYNHFFLPLAWRDNPIMPAPASVSAGAV